jgi:RNA polymerase sigma factor (sigma-70 family)
MMKCEEVHEGLVLVLGRLPNIEEWASACGFKDYDAELCDPNYRETHYVSSIRPTSNSNTIENRAVDTSNLSPNFFVGNTLANNTGVGRGRGRKSKPPPTILPNFYDDSVEKFSETKVKAHRKPVNTGTPSDFVSLMHDGKTAKSKMVECNMRLVVSIARRYYNVGVNIQDLVQEGSLGLMRAAEKFIPSKGFKFSTYASWWIQQAVFRSIAYNSRTIRLPVHVHNWLNRVRRIRTTLQEDLGRAPTNDEIAKELDMTPEKFSKMLLLTRRTISLEMPKYQNNPKDMGHESEASLGDSVDSSAAIRDDTTPEQRVDQGLFQDDLKDMLNILGDDEKKVICLRYGLDDGLTRTVTTVALQLHQTKAWVRSQECRALRKLRRPWYEKRLKEHQNSITGQG